jgi:hypothetical protein
MRNPWFADGVLFDRLDVPRWALYAFLAAGLLLGLAYGIVIAEILNSWGAALLVIVGVVAANIIVRHLWAEGSNDE